MTMKGRLGALLFLWPVLLLAQYGGRPGDVVIYAVTANGSGDFQLVSPTTANTAANLASFHVTTLDSVPFTPSAPFLLTRKVLYTTATETFQVGLDVEPLLGLHRVFVHPVRLFIFKGIIHILPGLVGSPNSFTRLEQGLDVYDDVALEDLWAVSWFPAAWPFIVTTDQKGPYPCPGNTSGYACLLTIPGGIVPAALLPWVNLAALYPGVGWLEGFDLKLLDNNPTLGDTIRQLRLRAGKQTPTFRIPGHTHLFVLQGGVNITPVGGATVTLKQYDYAYLPENFSVTLSNPSQYKGPGGGTQ